MNHTPPPPYPPPILELPFGWPKLRRLWVRCLELAHAGALPATLLLVGEPGLGREALAMELAAALVCRSKPRQLCSCRSCDRARRGLHPDVHLLQPRSATQRRGEEGDDEDDGGQRKKTISIDDVRDLIATLDRRPYEGARRVVILDSVHTPPLGVEAAAALLKSLEEPPPSVVVLALAANPRHVLPTIVSRAVQVRVPPPSLDEATALLAAIAALSPEQARAQLAAVGGDLGVALGLRGADITELVELVAMVLRGDGVAVSVLARRLKHMETVVPLLAAIVATLAARPRDDAENLLKAAAVLLSSQRVATALNIGLDSVAAGRLAALD